LTAPYCCEKIFLQLSPNPLKNEDHQMNIWFPIALVAFLSSCATTFVEKDKKWNPKKEVPALMVHYSYVDEYSLARGQSMFEAVKDIVQASQGKQSPLAISGEKALARLKPVFAHYNMQVYFDRAAAEKATTIQGVIKANRTNNDGGKKGFLADGDWLHPDTVEEPFHMPGTLFQDKYYKQIAAKTLDGAKDKVAVSMGMTVNVERSWILGWKCVARFRARALNSNGKPVFLVSSSGESSTHWFGGKDRYLVSACPEAAEDSLATLAKVKPGVL
jgi:hypothetical protein